VFCKFLSFFCYLSISYGLFVIILILASQVPIIRGILYVVAQCVGAIAGSAILRALSADTMENYLGVVKLSNGVTPVQGFGVEFFLALILVLVVCGACDAAKPDSKGIAPLIIGLAVTVGHIVGVSISIVITKTVFTYFKSNFLL